MAQPRVIILRHRHVHAEVVHGNKLEYGCARRHPLADLGHALGDHPVIRGRQLVTFEHDFAPLLLGLETLMGRRVDIDLGLPCLDLVLRSVFALGQALGDAQAALRVLDLAGGLRDLRFGLLIRCLFEFGVELQHQVARLHVCAAVVIDLAHQASHRGGNLRGVRRCDRAGELQLAHHGRLAHDFRLDGRNGLRQGGSAGIERGDQQSGKDHLSRTVRNTVGCGSHIFAAQIHRRSRQPQPIVDEAPG